MTESNEQEWPVGYIYAPNSIYHGEKIRQNSVHDSLINMTCAYHRMIDFVDFLFNHSEHCDHISESDAWKEFEEFEVKDSYVTINKTNQ